MLPETLRLLRSAAVAAAAAASCTTESASGTLLYVTSYAGTITSLNLTRAGSGGSTGAGSLESVASNTGCEPSPSWLTLDHANGILYCLDEGLTAPNGSLSSYRTSANGTLVQLAKVPTIGGPVSSVMYGQGDKALAAAE